MEVDVMARIRIHELAKKLGKENKEILNYLTEKGIQVKSPMNSLEEEQVAMVEDKFGKKETKPEGKAEAAEEKKAPAKKKNITQVFHPQNSRTGIGRGTRGSQNRTEGQQGRRNDGQNNRQDGQTQNRDGQNRTGQQGGPRRDGQNGGGRFRDGNNDSRNQGQGRRNDGQNRTGQQGGPRRDGQNGGGRFRDGNNDSRNQGQGRRNDGQRPSGGRNQGSRMGGGSAVMEKPITKESRNRNDRGRNDRQDKVDKFESKSNRLGQGGKNNSKNNNGRGGKNNKQQVKQPTPPVQEKKEDEIKTITLPETMTIKELADAMKIQASAIIKKLFLEGVMVTVNQEIDFEKAEEIALEFNCIAEKEEKVDVIEELLHEEEEDESTMVSRPPVVCVMGHVDHGKTSLLDAIRNTHVIAKEAGGITQHIGAYVVDINGQKITFLDTPGHEAFTAMRMRGANATDIAILVVAADDGVMPQTVEAINHAKAAGTEIIVAINKIDKPSANIDRVKQELSEYELIPEDWGGSTIFVPVSAHTHEGIDTLLEMILLTAEVSELKANPNRAARGLIIEAELDKGKGPVATVLVQKGTLHVGDPVACGSSYGKVRAMMDDKGRRVKEAGPSTPVEILGLSDVPNAGEIFVACENDKEARNFAETFVSEGRERLLEETKARMSLDDLFSQIQAGDLKELNIIVKADVQGSVEAVKQSLLKLSNDEVVVKIIHGGVGAINESDVSLASASNAIIIGFNVRPDATAKATAEREGVDVRLYRVIYDAIADVEAAMKGMLDPIFEEKVIGHAEVRQLFKASGVGTIAGSYVLDGTFQRGCSVRITREGTQIFEGPLASLKRFKDDVKEVRAGYECGLVFEKFNDVHELDQVEAYIMVEVPR
jgi:translation initiation factor IF-2